MGIEYGTTATYSEVATLIGTAPRAVGQAMARNPTPLAIPCHRVVGKHGPGGFTPSLEIKEALLLMEKKQAGKRHEVRGEHDAKRSRGGSHE
jgi:methylated-DNA-[protein]-cysteine S-methyltransferase